MCHQHESVELSAFQAMKCAECTQLSNSCQCLLT